MQAPHGPFPGPQPAPLGGGPIPQGPGFRYVTVPRRNKAVPVFVLGGIALVIVIVWVAVYGYPRSYLDNWADSITGSHAPTGFSSNVTETSSSKIRGVVFTDTCEARECPRAIEDIAGWTNDEFDGGMTKEEVADGFREGLEKTLSHEGHDVKITFSKVYASAGDASIDLEFRTEMRY